MKQLYTGLLFLLLPRNFCNGQKLKCDDSAMNYVSFVENPFQKLTSSTLSSLEVSELSECTFECLENQSCYSLNFGEAKADGRHPCELLSGDMFKENRNFVAHGDFHRYNIKVGFTINVIRNTLFCFPMPYNFREFERHIYGC